MRFPPSRHRWWLVEAFVRQYEKHWEFFHVLGFDFMRGPQHLDCRWQRLVRHNHQVLLWALQPHCVLTGGRGQLRGLPQDAPHAYKDLSREPGAPEPKGLPTWEGNKALSTPTFSLICSRKRSVNEVSSNLATILAKKQGVKEWTSRDLVPWVVI